MHHRLLRLHASVFTAKGLWAEELFALILAIVVVVSPASAVIRFQERGLYMNSTTPGATTFYKLSLRYVSPVPVGSLHMKFCIDPIPYMPCVSPPGLDVSNAILNAQTGETGFSILSQTANDIILTRPPILPAAAGQSTYTFSNIVNPTDTLQSFSIRLSSYSSVDATGTEIDVGSVKGQVTNGIVIETQVPPMLIYCLAEEVALGCTSSNNNYYTNMGQLSEDDTLTATSQLAVGTNATDGFVVTSYGSLPAAGTNVIDGLSTPTESKKGKNQFGINLVANSDPGIGQDPEGTWANAQVAAGYNQPNKYKFVNGDIVATSSGVSLMKKFTVSYIINSKKDLPPGVYTTTVTFLASGRF